MTTPYSLPAPSWPCHDGRVHAYVRLLHAELGLNFYIEHTLYYGLCACSPYPISSLAMYAVIKK